MVLMLITSQAKRQMPRVGRCVWTLVIGDQGPLCATGTKLRLGGQRHQ